MDNKEKVGAYMRGFRTDRTGGPTVKKFCKERGFDPLVWSALENGMYDLWDAKRFLKKTHPMYVYKEVKVKTDPRFCHKCGNRTMQPSQGRNEEPSVWKLRSFKFIQKALFVAERKLKGMRVRAYGQSKGEKYLVMRTVVSTLRFVLGINKTITGFQVSPCLAVSEIHDVLADDVPEIKVKIDPKCMEPVNKERELKKKKAMVNLLAETMGKLILSIEEEEKK